MSLAHKLPCPSFVVGKPSLPRFCAPIWSQRSLLTEPNITRRMEHFPTRESRREKLTANQLNFQLASLAKIVVSFCCILLDPKLPRPFSSKIQRFTIVRIRCVHCNRNSGKFSFYNLTKLPPISLPRISEWFGISTSRFTTENIQLSSKRERSLLLHSEYLT